MSSYPCSNYSRVPNKRASENNQGVGWKWFDITIIGRLEQSEGGYLEKLQIVVILAYLLYIYVNSDILIHLPMNSGSVECTSWDFFLHLF